MRTTRSTTTLALAVTAGLVLAGCGGTDPAEPTETTSPETTAEPTEPEPTDEPTDEPPVTDGVDPVPDDELPGESMPLYFPEGAEPDVVGVSFDDVLVVRALPDPAADPVGELAPTGSTTTTGRERAIDSGLWAEVELGSGVGWVNTVYLGYLGATSDTTAEYADALPEIANPREVTGTIGQHAAEANTAVGGADDAWTVVEQADENAPTQAVVDVLGYPDDAQRGERLRIEFTVESLGGQVSLIESAVICGRGVTEDGLCL